MSSSPSTLRITISGMLCMESCGTNIEKALNGLSIVKDAKIDFDSKIAKVTLFKQADTESIAKIYRTIQEVGYDIENIERVDDKSSPSKNNKKNDAEGDGLKGKILEISIGGMTCQGCARKVEQALASAPGMKDASVQSVDVKSGIAVIKGEFAEGDDKFISDLKEAIERLGVKYQWRGYYRPFQQGGGEVGRGSSKDDNTDVDNNIDDEQEDGNEKIILLDRLKQELSQKGETVSTTHGAGLTAVEIGLEVWSSVRSPRLADTSKADRNRVRNALRSTSGVVCALVDGDKRDEKKLIARVRIRLDGVGGPSQVALLEAVRRLGYDAAVISPEEAQSRIGVTGEDAEKPVVEQEDVTGHLGDSKAIFDVKGMTCGACVSTIESVLNKAPGVVTAKVALLSEKAEILFDSHVTDAERLKEAVELVGYDAKIVRVIREDGTKSLASAVFEVEGQHQEGALFPSVYAGLTATEGVLEVSPFPDEDGSGKATVEVSTTLCRILVKYEPELVGLRDLVKVMSSQGYRARLLPDVIHGGEEGAGCLGSSLSSKQQENLLHARQRLLFALSFTIPVTVLAMAPSNVFLLDDPPLTPGLRLRDVLLLLLSFPVQFGAGAIFYRETFKGLKGGSYGMALLVSMGTTTAWLFAVFSLLRSWASGGRTSSNSDFFMTSCMLLSFILLGKYLEHAAKKGTSTALTKLMDFAPKMALLVSDKDEEELIPIELVQRGDLLKVVRGTKVPADGLVVSGEGFIDEALITGESLPVTKREGDRVVGGSLCTEGLLTMRVTGIGEDSTVQQIIRLMENAQMSKAPIQALVDKIAGSFALWVLGISVLVFLGWWLALSTTKIIPESWIPQEGSSRSSPFLLALTLGVSTMVVACPCAMGLATPTAIMVGTGVGAVNGILIKGGEALERAYRLSAVVFDKTGTLTMGQPEVESFHVLNDSLQKDVKKVLWQVASAERGSEHPLAKCLIRYANKRSGRLHLVDPQEFQAVSGKGLLCRVGGEKVAVGNLAWLKEIGMELPPEKEQTSGKLAAEMGKIIIWAGIGDKAAARFEILDAPRPEARQVLHALSHNLRLQVFMVTGDNVRTSRTVGQALGLSPRNIMAETLPSNKVSKIKELQERGHVVAMVGDGINDAPALAQADVGIAIGAGTDIAIEAADMVLMKSDLKGVLTAIHLSRVIVRRIYVNLIWAFVYNIISIPLAAGLLMPIFHTAIPPYVAGAAMALSSISVLASSLALKWYRPPHLESSEEFPSEKSSLLSIIVHENSSTSSSGRVSNARYGSID